MESTLLPVTGFKIPRYHPLEDIQVQSVFIPSVPVFLLVMTVFSISVLYTY